VNEQIRLSPVRVIDENNEMLGIMTNVEALNKARDAGLDLVEVAPTERPPVCRIMDYGKYKYKQSKKEHQQKAHSHVSQVKELWMGPNTEEHDRVTKTNHARAFLEEGDRVQITIRFRGGQMRHIENGRAILAACKKDLADVAKVEREAKMEGRRMTMLMAPAKAGSGAGKDAGAKPKPKPPAPPAAPGAPAAVPAAAPATAPAAASNPVPAPAAAGSTVAAPTPGKTS
jgi:translation initiation factor IF-3